MNGHDGAGVPSGIYLHSARGLASKGVGPNRGQLFVAALSTLPRIRPKTPCSSASTPRSAAVYADYVASTPASVPSATALDAPSFMKKEIARFFVWAREHGGKVVGGLQTAPGDAPVTGEVIGVLRRFYKEMDKPSLFLTI